MNSGKGRGRLERSAIVVKRADVLLQPLARKRRRLTHDLQPETFHDSDRKREEEQKARAAGRGKSAISE